MSHTFAWSQAVPTGLSGHRAVLPVKLVFSRWEDQMTTLKPSTTAVEAFGWTELDAAELAAAAFLAPTADGPWSPTATTC